MTGRTYAVGRVALIIAPRSPRFAGVRRFPPAPGRRALVLWAGPLYLSIFPAGLRAGPPDHAHRLAEPGSLYSRHELTLAVVGGVVLVLVAWAAAVLTLAGGPR